ncbi:type II toxin-antitoxin system VapB family antitoxin [Sphingobium sp. EP60837]|uniref:type II toxin-antitoxin system VapB family antitoxin n=1 Tax=Sphingobium sp. EP60837 TaxID=1855519 RepID=UPI0009ECD39B
MRDIVADRLLRTLAKRHKIGLTEAVKLAVRHELAREDEAIPLDVRIKALRTEVLRRPSTGHAADKAL